MDQVHFGESCIVPQGTPHIKKCERPDQIEKCMGIREQCDNRAGLRKEESEGFKEVKRGKKKEP